MKRRRLGNSGETISAIGLGCAGMSGGYGKTDDKQSLHTLSVAADHGIDFFDTSDAYGLGHNERLLGQFLKSRPEAIKIGTKFGLVGKPGNAATTIDNSPEHIGKACDASLQRLGVDTIDLYYCHRRDATVPVEEMVGAMADLVKLGKVRHLGLCEVRPDTLIRAHQVHPIAAVQSEYSLWTRDAEKEMLDTCSRLGVTFVAFCPLGRAFLAGTVTSISTLEGDDFRRRLPRFQSEALEQNLRLVHALESFATERNVTSSQIALAWLLAKHPHVVPIPGTKRERHVIENAAVADVSLSSQDVQTLDALFPPSIAVGERYPPTAMAGIET